MIPANGSTTEKDAKSLQYNRPNYADDSIGFRLDEKRLAHLLKSSIDDVLGVSNTIFNFFIFLLFI